MKRLVLFAVLLVASCGDDSNFNGDGGNDATSNDGGPPSDAPVTDVQFQPSDSQPAEASQPKPVSSLSLEQVWFITGEPLQAGRDMFIDFRKADAGPPTVTCGPQVPISGGNEGTAVFTDPSTGQLLFYTDGINVWNGFDNSTLANGTGVFGQPSASEPSLITPQLSADGGTFYVFSVNYSDDTSPSGSIYYSTIDLNQGTHGTVTSKNNLLHTGNVGEALDMLPHSNNTDFWVLGYDGAGQVEAFLVNQNGVSTTPVISQTGITGTVLRSAINHSYDYDHVVLAINEGGATGTIAVADVDRSTGKLTNVKKLVTGDLGFHASYSGDGTKLYYVRGTEGWSGVAYQYDLTTSTETMLGGTGLAAAKLAPDGKVYYVGYGQTSLAVVNSPDQAGTNCKFVAAGLPLGGCAAAFGVPNQTAAYLNYLPPAPPTN
jgi:hypothetical protein